ncbi:sulfatase [Halorhabdus sp. CUG00001]|uniref:sulfatase n=1 Tax=Halorhabdus sp. CUG00001 TaxID=2600297 RepID=UPI00131B33A9|nr:sulfatase [Halorhabdus sp. CUG00001]
MAEKDTRRNVVLVTVDSLRADHCGFMGYDDDTTPTLDAMAEDGVVFRNAVAPGPSTSESMPAIFTGHYPFERKGVSGAIDERIGRIKPHMDRHRTLAEQFSEHGYATAGFTPNPFTTRYFGFDSGFDYYEDFLDGSRGKFYEWLVEGRLSDSTVGMPARVLLNWLAKEEVFKRWEHFVDDVLEWVETAPEPYFLWVFLMDAHHPYLPPRSYRSKSTFQTLRANLELRRQNYEPPFSDPVAETLVTAYDDSIRYVDAFLDRMRTELKGDPILAITGDHGEAFGEHGTYEHHGGALGEHGSQEYNSYLYEENIHVPLVVANTDASGSVERPFSLRSLCDLFDVSETGLVVNPDATDQFVVSRTFDGDSIAVRGGRTKYIRDDDREAVYDLEAGESTPITDEQLRRYMSELTDAKSCGLQEGQHIVKACADVVSEQQL